MTGLYFNLAAGCLAAALGGYYLARTPVNLAENETEGAQAIIRTPNGRAADVVHRRTIPTAVTRTPQQLKSLKEDLQKRFSTSPSAAHDWALRAEAASILATMSAEELEGFAREMHPAGSETSGFTPSPEVKHALLREVFRHWGSKDPGGASLGLLDSPMVLRAEVFDDWMRRDPEAAREWVTAGNLPTGGEMAGKRLLENFLNHQAVADFPSARDSLGMLDPDTQKRLLLDWSQSLALDPVRRDELLALLASRGDAEFTGKCYERVVREMAAKSPAEASRFIEKSELPDEQKHALSEQMLGEWAIQDPHQAFAAWAALKEDAAPTPLLRAMDSWSINSPGAEEAIEWVKKLDPGPSREQFKTHLIQSMSGGERYAQAADLGNTLDYPQERIRHLKIVKREWEEKFPKQAREWFGKLPARDREAVGVR